MRYTPTFENFTNGDTFSVHRVNHLKKKKPVLFLDFSFDCEDADGNVYNVEKLMRKYIDLADYSGLKKIHYFNGDIYVGKNRLDKYSLVFIYQMKDKIENFALVRDYCMAKNIPFIPQGNYDNDNNKYQQLLALHNEGLKIPKTYTFSLESFDIDLISKEFSYPFILKSAYGAHGKNVDIIKSESELIQGIKKYNPTSVEMPKSDWKNKGEFLLIQEFIPNDCDYRVMFIENKHVFTVKRSRDKEDKKEFRNNIALGAKGVGVKLGVEAMNIAERAHKCMGFYTSGVDLIQNKETGEWSVLEVNSTPNFGFFGPEPVIKIFAANINALR